MPIEYRERLDDNLQYSYDIYAKPITKALAKRPMRPEGRYVAGETARNEALATAALRWFCEWLETSNFRYMFSTIDGIWSDEAIDKRRNRLLGNCKILASGFNSLLQHLGFPFANLGFQGSNEDPASSIKIAQAPNSRISGDDVKGLTGLNDPYPYIGRKYPVDTVAQSNALYIRRGSWWPGRHYNEQVVTVSHRDVFANHYCSHVSGLGFTFPYFDPLVGARYRHGQADMFEAFLNFGTFQYKSNKPTAIYRCSNSPRTMAYEIPASFHSVTGDATYTRMRTETQYAADPGNGGSDVRMYWMIEEEDWMDRNTGPSIIPEDARPHPLFVQQLFHVCTTSRWDHTLSYGADRVIMGRTI